MYSKIHNPKTNRNVNINSTLGKKILSSYLNKSGLLGGGTNEKEKRFITANNRIKILGNHLIQKPDIDDQEVLVHKDHSIHEPTEPRDPDTKFSFIKPSKNNLSKFKFPNLSVKDNKYYFQNNSLLEKTLVTNNGYLELHPEYLEIDEIVELFYSLGNSRIKNKLFIRKLTKFYEYPIWNLITIPVFSYPMINLKCNNPLIHKIDSSKYLSGIYGYEYYRIPCKDKIDKKILFLWDYHSTFFTPPSSETFDILELIDHYVRKCELNKNCLDIFIEDAKDINITWIENIEKRNKVIGGSPYVRKYGINKIHRNSYGGANISDLISDLMRLKDSESSVSKTEVNEIEKKLVNLIVLILKTYISNTEFKDYIKEINNKFENYNGEFNSNSVYQLVPYIYTYFLKISEDDGKINYVKMIELIISNLNDKFISYLVASEHIQEKTIMRMRFKGGMVWNTIDGVRVHQIDISQQHHTNKITKAFYLDNYDLSKFIIKIIENLPVYSKEDFETFLIKLVSIDKNDTNGNIYNLKNNINDKKSLYLYCISCKDNDSYYYWYERGKQIAEKLLNNRKNLIKEISNHYTPVSQEILEKYESYFLDDQLFQYLNDKTEHQMDNIDDSFFTKKQLVSYMLELIDIYPSDQNFLDPGGVRLFITETYAIARMFRIFDSTKNRVENCDINNNSLKNIIYFGGGSHNRITTNFIKKILKIEPLSSDHVSNHPAYKYLQGADSKPRYVNLDGTNFFFKNSKSVVEKQDTM